MIEKPITHEWQYKTASGEATSEISAILGIASMVSDEFPKLSAEECLEGAVIAIKNGVASIQESDSVLHEEDDS